MSEPETTGAPPPTAPDAPHAMPEGEEPPPRGVRVMAAVRWGLVVLVALAAIFALERYYGEDGDASTIYYCPMHPSVQQDHPGSCPICSMTLVPMPAHPAPVASDVPGLVPIDLSPERVQLIGVRTAQVTRAPLAPELRATGTIAAPEKGRAVVQTRFAGWIERLEVEETGQPVRRGQVLARLYSPELLAAQEEHLNAVRWERSGETASGLSAHVRADSRKRLELLGIDPQEIDELERTGAPMRAIPLRSPAGGHVIDKAAVQGLYVQPGTTLFQIADLSTVWVLADVHESEIGRVRVGQPASVELAAYPGETFLGKVTFVLPSLDPGTRTLQVRLELPNPGLRLRPGMFGTVRLELERSEPVLVVPAEAIIDTGVLRYVFVARPGGRFEPRRVELGARSHGVVHVRRGLAEGDTVVTTANFLLDSESHLRASLLGMSAAHSADAGAGDAALPNDGGPP